MKKNLFLIIAGIVLFAFILMTSLIWYRLFYNDNDNGDMPSSNSVGSLEVQLDKSNNVINESSLIPLSSTEALKLTPYEFKVRNKGSRAVIYNILIEDSAISDDASYNSRGLLNRSQLEYQLICNGNLVKTGLLSDVKNNILDEREIDSNNTNSYQIRVYVSESAKGSEWQNKYYHFDIRVQVKEEK